jgi:hypothetical protein
VATEQARGKSASPVVAVPVQQVAPGKAGVGMRAVAAWSASGMAAWHARAKRSSRALIAGHEERRLLADEDILGQRTSPCSQARRYPCMTSFARSIRWSCYVWACLFALPDPGMGPDGTVTERRRATSTPLP